MTEHVVKDTGETELSLEQMKAEQEMMREKAERKRFTSPLAPSRTT